MIVVLCANGNVVWVIERVSLRGMRLICLQDQTVILYQRSPRAAWLAAAQQMVQHSVALQGALRAISQLDMLA